MINDIHSTNQQGGQPLYRKALLRGNFYWKTLRKDKDKEKKQKKEKKKEENK